jgi:hypothetical protein
MNLPLYRSTKTIHAARILSVDTERAPEGGAILLLDIDVEIGGIKPSVAVGANFLMHYQLRYGHLGYLIREENECGDVTYTYEDSETFEQKYEKIIYTVV